MQLDLAVRARRPQGLPERSPESEGRPIRDEAQQAGQCVGKGRGQASARPCFVTPPSKVPGLGYDNGGDDVAGHGKQTEGRVPSGMQTMGRLDSRDDSGLPAHDSLQRALERELVDQLREQNAKLMAQLEVYQRRNSPGSGTGNGSTQSWVEVPREKDGTEGRQCSTPRNGSQHGAHHGKVCRFTPNGTRIPDGTPPKDEGEHIPKPPSLPPVPPFPTMAGEASLEMWDRYEVMDDVSKGRMGERAWKPPGEKQHEPTPGEARAFWLEREVLSLKQSLAKMTGENPFRTSEYWSKGFHPPTGPPLFSGFPESPTDLGKPDPEAAERISRANPGDPDSHLRGGGGETELQDRAGTAMGDDVCGQARAWQSDRRVCHDGRAVASAQHQGVCHDGRAVASSQHQGVYPDGRALGAKSLHPGVCPDNRAHGVEYLHPEDPQRSCHLPRHHGGGGFGGGMDSIPTSWESGGIGSSTKADLPELPSTASPLQFGDWIHLCGPVMRDLSMVASRWWDLTVRQAQVHYADWKQATPLQRVQIDPKIPDELNDRVYGRTEQRGVHLLLKSVAPEIQQMLVTDRQMTSTAILYRLYIRYQPGGPGEKSLILKELTQLPKTNTMAELATALRSWRRHYGRAREVGASLPDGTLLLRALESGVQLVAKENSQAAFRLAQSRAALQVDEIPEPASIWDFSQCLLAEAETLVLMSSTTSSSAETTPLKLKVMEANDTSAATKPQQEGNSTGKGRGGTADVPCRWFKSDTGCRAGKLWKWLHSWEGISDKNARCWNCGAKDHRKQDCKVKGGGSKAKDETKVSGGGNVATTNKAAGGTSTGTPTTPSSMTSTPTKPKINEMAASSASTTMLSPGELKTGNPGMDNVESVKGLGDGGTGGEQAAKNEKTAELLHEATQLLKTLRVPQ